MTDTEPPSEPIPATPNRSRLRTDDLWPDWLSRLQLRFMNPLFRRLTPYLPGFALIEHVGRKSGRTYTTPVNAVAGRGQMVFGLGHGRSDWARNILAAGHADVRHLGRTVRLVNPRIITTDEPKSGLPMPMRIAGRRLELLVLDIDDRAKHP